MLRFMKIRQRFG